MRIALRVLAVLFLILLVVVAVGFALPVKHRAVREARYSRSPSEIFALITDAKNFPAWRPSVKSVDILPDSGGRKRYREHGSDGEILYEVEESVPDRRLITRIADPSLPFGGRWRFDLIPSGDSTTLRITEDGEVYNPVFRFVSRFIMGHTSTIERYLTDVSERFGAAEKR